MERLLQALDVVDDLVSVVVAFATRRHVLLGLLVLTLVGAALLRAPWLSLGTVLLLAAWPVAGLGLIALRLRVTAAVSGGMRAAPSFARGD